MEKQIDSEQFLSITPTSEKREPEIFALMHCFERSRRMGNLRSQEISGVSAGNSLSVAE